VELDVIYWVEASRVCFVASRFRLPSGWLCSFSVSKVGSLWSLLHLKRFLPIHGVGDVNSQTGQ